VELKGMESAIKEREARAEAESRQGGRERGEVVIRI